MILKIDFHNMNNINFNPNENGLRDKGIFGLPFSEENSQIILVPVPWEVTTSYNPGTSNGPKSILESSHQIDLYDQLYPDGWKHGISYTKKDNDIKKLNENFKRKANIYLENYCNGKIDKDILIEINEASNILNQKVEKITKKFIDNNKIVGLIGGDHSVIYGYLKTLSRKYENFGILQIDAHADLRPAYEGFEFSHASIFYNALNIKNIKHIVQIGIRDISPIEGEIIDTNIKKGRISTFFDQEIKNRIYQGDSWENICNEIINKLPDLIYISFDIDGLDPSLCPNTGTPVPGGFKMEELVYLFEKITKSGKKIIGFDLCEVSKGNSNSEWDGNVGARVLYKLCMSTLKSQNY
jgi:agmatinase